jgi:Ni/Co efflux regulator RcnB
VRLVLALLAAALAALSSAKLAEADRNADRAAAALAAMRHEFLDRTTARFREADGSRAPAHAWPYSQALAATIAMARVPGRGRAYIGEARSRVAGLRWYRRASGAFAAGAGSDDVYYDDNEWIALQLVDWWSLSHEHSALAQAARSFEVVVRAWDRDESHPCPGGVFWTNAAGNDDRNTVTTATGALLAMKLYEATRNRYYVMWARRMLAWVDECMRAPDGLLWDHMSLDGTRDETHWSYNQGTAIGAHVLLYRLTGDESALARAEQLADASLAYFDLNPTGREPAAFLAIFFRNAIELAAVDRNGDYRAAAQAYADAAWEHARLPRTNVFKLGGDATPTLLAQAAMVQIYAALTTDR